MEPVSQPNKEPAEALLAVLQGAWDCLILGQPPAAAERALMLQTAQRAAANHQAFSASGRVLLQQQCAALSYFLQYTERNLQLLTRLQERSGTSSNISATALYGRSKTWHR